MSRSVKNAIESIWLKCADAVSTMTSHRFHKLAVYRLTANSQSPAKILFGRKLRLPVVTPYEMGEKVEHRLSDLTKLVQCVKYVVSEGFHTSYIIKNDKVIVALNNQLPPRNTNEDIYSEESFSSGVDVNARRADNLLKSELENPDLKASIPHLRSPCINKENLSQNVVVSYPH